jgi:hypothetical protein
LREKIEVTYIFITTKPKFDFQFQVGQLSLFPQREVTCPLFSL